MLNLEQVRQIEALDAGDGRILRLYLDLDPERPDLDVPTPEQEVERAELRQCVDSALAGLPEEWRAVLRLRFERGLKGAALAQALGKSAAETSRLLKLAQTYLKQRLVESGCAFTPAGPLTDARPSS